MLSGSSVARELISTLQIMKVTFFDSADSTAECFLCEHSAAIYLTNDKLNFSRMEPIS